MRFYRKLKWKITQSICITTRDRNKNSRKILKKKVLIVNAQQGLITMMSTVTSDKIVAPYQTNLQLVREEASTQLSSKDNKINFVGGDKLLPFFKHGFLRSEENVFPAIFIHTKCVSENIFIYNFDYLCMVDSIAIHVGRCYCLVISNTLVFMAEVIAMFVCCFFY